jgi:ABC-type Fe3+-siderophore transport system permease subunit
MFIPIAVATIIAAYRCWVQIDFFYAIAALAVGGLGMLFVGFIVFLGSRRGDVLPLELILYNTMIPTFVMSVSEYMDYREQRERRKSRERAVRENRTAFYFRCEKCGLEQPYPDRNL